MRFSTLCLAGLLGVLAAPVGAQFLHSQSLEYPNGRMLISIALRQSSPQTIHAVSVTPTTRFLIQAPSSVRTDSRGYAALVIDVQCLSANSNPERFTVTLTDPVTSRQARREYLLECVNNVIGSAWPDFMMIQGAFCNPPTDSSSHLQIERASDLDGDGIYGDLQIEAEPNGRDPIDFPNEFVTDVNGQGTNGCLGGSPGGVFRPSGVDRHVAWFADNRVWGGANTCDWTTQMNFVQDMSFGPFNGAPAMFATSSTFDTVIIGKDANNDGNIGTSEIKVFFDPNVLVNAENYSPDGVAVDPSNARRVYWISDKSGATGSPTNQGIFRLTDANGDDAIGAGEVVATWTGTTGAVQVEAQTIDHTEFECVHVGAAGGVLVNQTALGTIFRWVDGNGNGIAETGEVTNWLTYNLASALTRSADWLADPSFPSFPGPFFGMNLIESTNVGGREVYFIGSTDFTGSTSGFIFRCVDGNNDGDVNDAGEVKIFNNGTPSSIYNTTAIKLNGLDIARVDVNGNGAIEDSEVYVYAAMAEGPAPSCGYTFGDLTNWRFVDLNGDGDALDGAAEAHVMSLHSTGAFNRGLEVVPGAHRGGFRHSFYSRSAFVTVQPANCTTSTAGEYIELDLVRERLEEGTQGTPFAGNSRFAIEVRGATGLAAVAVLFAIGEQRPPFPFGPCTVGLMPPLFASIPAKVPDASGRAQFPVPVPVGISGTLYFQSLGLTPSIQFLFGEVNEMRVQ